MNKEILDSIRRKLRECQDIETLKRVYRQLVKQWHPDKNPDIDTTGIMKEINCIYDNQIDELSKDFTDKKKNSTLHESEIFKDVIDRLVHIDDITIEICGIFIWISGNTKPYKELFKELQFSWAKRKKQWYYRPDWYIPRNRNEWSIDEIRSKYGSETVQSEPLTKVK